MNIFTCWKPLYIMYSFERLRCGVAFLSRFDLETPIFGKSIQKAELLDFIIDYEQICCNMLKRTNCFTADPFMSFCIHEKLSSTSITKNKT
jgi:hypothetical protein